MRALNLTTVYAVLLVFCLLTPRIATTTSTLSDELWFLCMDFGEEESEEESQEEKAEAEFYFFTAALALDTSSVTPAEEPIGFARVESLYHPEVFAPPPEV